MRAPASDAILSARSSIGSACRALRVDAQISQLRFARHATGSSPTGVPNGGYFAYWCPTAVTSATSGHDTRRQECVSARPAVLAVPGLLLHIRRLAGR
jgi:hypothetical protein